MLWAWKYGIVSHEQKPDFDPCRMCRDGNVIVLPTGEMYRLCGPNKWKSYECAARQLVALKPAARAELPTAAKLFAPRIGQLRPRADHSRSNSGQRGAVPTEYSRS